MIGLGIALVLAGIILLLAGLGQAAQNKSFANAETVHGSVVYKRERHLKNGKAYELTVAYTVNAVEYTKVVGVRLSEYRNISEGDGFDLIYRPDKPNKAINPDALNPKNSRTVLIFGAVLAGIGLILMLSLFGCGKSNDRPPDPGTPIPAAHVGTYACEYGELIFPGDGTTVTVRFSESLAEVVGIIAERDEFQYSFSWHDFGPCRYDVATKLKLFKENGSISCDFAVDSASEESIILTYYLQEGYEHMNFQFQNSEV